jgi:hypothetical protein
MGEITSEQCFYLTALVITQWSSSLDDKISAETFFGLDIEIARDRLERLTQEGEPRGDPYQQGKNQPEEFFVRDDEETEKWEHKARYLKDYGYCVTLVA